MTPEAQRIAIAEACGWKLKQAGDGEFHLIDPTGLVISADWEPSTTMALFSYKLPDYLNDLNAMHEAEKVIPSELEGVWVNYLTRNASGDYRAACARATAAQRAGAFLRTLGLWKD